jgi:hypothetical protein
MLSSKNNTRLLSGAEMSDYSVMQEHTLVLAGDTVDSGSVWQGWPSHQITPLEIYRKQVIQLVNRAVFRSAAATTLGSEYGSQGLAKRERDRKEMQAQMMEESKDSMRSFGGTLTNGHGQQQKRVSFKTVATGSTSASVSSSLASSPAKELSSEKDAQETTPLLKK